MEAPNEQVPAHTRSLCLLAVMAIQKNRRGNEDNRAMRREQRPSRAEDYPVQCIDLCLEILAVTPLYSEAGCIKIVGTPGRVARSRMHITSRLVDLHLSCSAPLTGPPHFIRVYPSHYRSERDHCYDPRPCEIMVTPDVAKTCVSAWRSLEGDSKIARQLHCLMRAKLPQPRPNKPRASPRRSNHAKRTCPSPGRRVP